MMKTLQALGVPGLMIITLAVLRFVAESYARVIPKTPRRYWLFGILCVLFSGLVVMPASAENEHVTALYRMKPAELGLHLAKLHQAEPDLRKRVAKLARQNIGQPYQLFPMGEFPFETIDPKPMFSLDKSDCVVFAEHTYAMALSRSWEEFFRILQRIRYKDGVIGVATRNHYTEADWNPANAWLVKDVTAEVAGDTVANYHYKVDRQAFFKSRYQLERPLAVETVHEAYVPKSALASRLSQMQDGDMFNVVSHVGEETQVTHVGLIVVAPDGNRNLIHSFEPQVREESLAAFLARVEAREVRARLRASTNNKTGDKSGTVLLGFKFLRLNPAPNVPPALAQPRS